MATVGEDYQPYAYRLDKLKLPQTHIREVKNTYTAQAFITTDLDDNQITAFHPGAMNYAHLNHIGDAKDVTLGIIAPDGRDGMVSHAREFEQAGIPFVFDPGQGLPMFNGEELRRFIDQATWVAVNDYEGQMLQERTGLSAAQIASRVRAYVVTQGAEGSVIHADGRQIAVPTARPEALVDPTGCGDAYRAGLVFGLENELDWETTGRIASLMGAIKIAHAGTQSHRFDMNEFKQRFRAAFGRDL
jgi:adenosine kinase